MERKLFYKTRAIRIWYIIDHNVSIDDIKNVMIANFDFIWWRYNQFFLLENNNFTQKDYIRLQEFDADFYVALCDITEELEDIISTMFSPLEILKRNQIEISYWEIKFHWGILYQNPSSLFIHRFNIINSDKIDYVNFVVNDWIENSLKETLLFNFWFPFDKNWRYKNIPIKDVNIENQESLLSFLNNYNWEKYYFKNILSQASYQRFWWYEPNNMSICLVIWNSIEDYLYFWNRNVINSKKESTFLNTFILPIDTLDGNEYTINSMINFIQKYINTRSLYKVSLHSCKFSVDELWKLELNTRLYEKDIHDEINYSTDWYVNYRDRDSITLEWKESIVNLNLWLWGNIISIQECFVTDIFLEYCNWEFWENMLCSDKAPLLWNRNNNAFRNIFYERDFLSGNAIPVSLRVNKSRSFSLYRTSIKPKDELYIIIPTAKEIIENIVQSEINCKVPEYDLIAPIAIQTNKNSNFDRTWTSKQWMRCNTILKLFWYDLWKLYAIVADEIRRNFFIKYNQSVKEKNTINKIEEIINDNDNRKPSKKLDNYELSKKIYLNVRNFYNPTNKYLLFRRILEELWVSDKLIKKYYFDKTLSPQNFTIQEREKILEIKNKLEFLINNWIMRLWIAFNCNSCWETYRIPIDEVSEEIHCQCCWNIQHLLAEENRAYSFNSLLKWSEVVWTFAVLEYLIKLVAELQHSSFIYSLWVNFGENNSWFEVDTTTDWDILALIQWYLVLCEVKNSWSWLWKSDFEHIENVAKKTRPDTIVFCSYWQPSTAKLREINRWINQLKNSLSKYWIKVKMDSIERNSLITYVMNPYLPM